MTAIDWLQAGVQLQIHIVIVNLRNLSVITNQLVMILMNEIMSHLRSIYKFTITKNLQQ